MENSLTQSMSFPWVFAHMNSPWVLHGKLMGSSYGQKLMGSPWKSTAQCQLSSMSGFVVHGVCYGMAGCRPRDHRDSNVESLRWIAEAVQLYTVQWMRLRRRLEMAWLDHSVKSLCYQWHPRRRPNSIFTATQSHQPTDRPTRDVSVCPSVTVCAIYPPVIITVAASVHKSLYGAQTRPFPHGVRFCESLATFQRHL